MSTQDKETLHLLAIFHYVIAGLVAFTACLPLFHITIGLFVTVEAITNNEPFMAIAGIAFMIFATMIIVVGWLLAVFIFTSGKNLDKQTNYKFCTIGAGVLCLFLPLGTILGVFTLVTLQEKSVKELFSTTRAEVDL